MAMASNSRVLQTIPLMLIVLLFCPFVYGKLINVDDDGQADFDNIQAGIDAANDGDTVLVASGEYVITEPITFRGKAITVKSEARRDETTIRMGTPSGLNRGSVVVFENGETTESILEGFTIIGGTGFRLWVPPESEFAWAGGGIYFDASSGTLRNCAIVQNRAKHAGGVLISSGPFVTLIDCIVAGNTAEGGVCGGVMCWDNSHVTMTKCTVTGNSSVGHGGGVYCRRDDYSQESSLTMTDCVISGNSSSAEAGGGVACWYGSLILTRCIILNNAEGYYFGGGVYVGHASATLTNCVIAQNTATRGGGGVGCSYPDASLTITNCTICGNSGGSYWGGGGVLCRNASATVTNSIIWGNTAPEGREISVQDAASTLTITYSNVAGGQATVSVEGGCTLNWAEGNIDADPHFADPTSDKYYLKSQAGRWDVNSQSWAQDDVTSPCIDMGDPMSPIGWELFPNGGFVNMGAYGGTSKASKSYFGEPVCETIVAGDINGDGQVNRADLEIMALHWTDDVPLPLP